MLVTLAVFAVVSNYAFPKFELFVKSQRFTAQINNLNGSILYARTEAIKRARMVTLTPINALNWAHGWVITIVDNDLQNIIIRQSQSLGGNTLLSSLANPKVIQFDFNGRMANDNTIKFSLCNIAETANKTRGRLLTISLTGKTSIKSNYLCS